MKNAGVVLSTLMMTLGACAPKAPATAGATDPGDPSATDSAGLYESHQHTDGSAPSSSPEDETTLKFPFCERDMKTQFSEKTEGAAFRAIVLFRILPNGKTAEHCYLRVEGEIKWEERSLGNVADWNYPVEFAGEQRERTVTFRLKQPPQVDPSGAASQSTPADPAAAPAAGQSASASQPAATQPPATNEAAPAGQPPAASPPPAASAAPKK